MNHDHHHHAHSASSSEAGKPPGYTLRNFLPLIIIFALIFAFTAVRQVYFGYFDLLTAMIDFEGSFFLVFGIFKLLNWRGFADAYQIYDIIAKRSRAYAFAYPLIELGFSAAYFFRYQLLIINVIVFVLMLIGALGVWQELRKGSEIPCACLGVVFKIPMTYVTLVEDLVMAAMALLMIFLLNV